MSDHRYKESQWVRRCLPLKLHSQRVIRRYRFLWTNRAFFCILNLVLFISIFISLLLPCLCRWSTLTPYLPQTETATIPGSGVQRLKIDEYPHWWHVLGPDCEPPTSSGGSIVTVTRPSDLPPPGINSQTLWNEVRSKVERQVPSRGRCSQGKHYIRHTEIFTRLRRLLSRRPSSFARPVPSNVAPAVC